MRGRHKSLCDCKPIFSLIGDLRSCVPSLICLVKSNAPCWKPIVDYQAFANCEITLSTDNSNEHILLPKLLQYVNAVARSNLAIGTNYG